MTSETTRNRLLDAAELTFAQYGYRGASVRTITAEADRASNTITITGEGVESVMIYFNDELVDLDKPVKIVLNGREREDVIPRSLDDLLALIVRGTSDSGKIYVARRSYDLAG